MARSRAMARANADLGRPDELAPRARHAPGHPGAARRRGTAVDVTARDFAQTLGLRERLGIAARGDRPPPRRPRWRPRASAWPPARSRWRTGPRAAASTSRSATAPTTSRSPRSCSASRARRRSTTSGRPRSTRSTAGSRAASSCPTRSRPSGSPATARPRASCAATRGSRRSTTSPTSRPTPPCSASSGSTAARRSPSCARRPRSRSTTASSTRSSRRCSSACASEAQVVVLPRTAEQREELAAAGGFCPRAGDRRAVADRLRRPRRLRGRHDEPRGGRARHAGLDDVRGPARAPSTSS